MENVESLLNRLLGVFESIVEYNNDKIFEIVVDETLLPKLCGSLGDAIIKEPKNSHWKKGAALIPICTLDYIAAGRPATIMLKSKKGVILSWPITDYALDLETGLPKLTEKNLNIMIDHQERIKNENTT